MSKQHLIKALDECLRTAGFRRRGGTWNRQAMTFWDVVALQQSKAGTEVTVNIGITDPEIHAHVWDSKFPTFVDEASCIVRVRLGMLLEGRDLWWPMGEASTCTILVAALRGHALPFIDDMHDRWRMEQFLEMSGAQRQPYPMPALYLALLAARRGDRTRACTILMELRTKSIGGWQTKVTALLKQLEC